MDNYRKSSVKLLPVIENTNNRVTFYTEFDGEFDVGDKLYIAVNDTGSTEYAALDSLANTGTTDDKMGYELLEKKGNRIVLNIKYDTFPLSSLSNGTCFIGRVYISNSTINRGTINGCMMKDTSTQPLLKSNMTWKQGILFDTRGSISNIDFNTKSSSDKLILKSIVNSKGEVESFYTKNNYGIGLSVINLSDNVFHLSNCNINAGVFNNCRIEGTSNEINNGELHGCFIGDTYTINGGKFYDCELESNKVTWNDGRWNSSYTGTTLGNPFKALTWNDGVWENGYFPLYASWIDGRFMNGIFNGIYWYNGEFDGGILSGTTWKNGIFNNGTVTNSVWEDGVFNGGTMIDTRWKNGTFNGGEISSTLAPYQWDNGTFNGGFMHNMSWLNGVFNDGIISGCTWDTGDFYGGKFVAGSTWNDGNWYGGDFENSTWMDGRFYKGIMKESKWWRGSVYYGVFIDMNNYPFSYFRKGIWYNGTMNNVLVEAVDWHNGIANGCELGRSYTGSVINWYNGSFNSGTFGYDGGSGEYNWYDGKFYHGQFSGTKWLNGTFYTGDITTYVNPKFQVGKPFKPYTAYGNVKNKNEEKRLPRKSKY